jgi:hypothetical protein
LPPPFPQRPALWAGITRALRRVCFTLAAGAAWAHASPAAASPGNGWVQNNVPVTEDGPGIKVGGNSRFHPGFAATIGFDQNPFSADRQEGKPAAAFVTPSAWLGIGNRRMRDGILDSPATATERKVDYNLRVLAGYRAYLSGDAEVRGAGKFNLLTQGRVMFLPGRRFSVGLAEDFGRLAEPRTFETAREFNFNRLDHRGELEFILRPGGGKFEIGAAYLSQVLYFEAGDISVGDRVANGAQARFKWRFRDQTALVATYQYLNTYYVCCAQAGTGRNEDSDGHRALLGVVGQLGKKWTLDAQAGYGGGFYKNDITDPEPNFSSAIGGIGAAYYPTLRTRIQARVERAFSDSLLGNYFTDIGGQLYGSHEFRWRMLLSAGVGVIGRRYHGLPVIGVETMQIAEYRGTLNAGSSDEQRQDTLVSASIQLEQSLGRFFVVAARYAAQSVITPFEMEFVGGFTDVAAFNRHLVMVFGAIRY